MFKAMMECERKRALLLFPFSIKEKKKDTIGFFAPLESAWPVPSVRVVE